MKKKKPKPLEIVHAIFNWTFYWFFIWLMVKIMCGDIDGGDLYKFLKVCGFEVD